MDIIELLQRNNIPYVLAKDNVHIRCPFCADDPSEHMGISLRGRGWNCWRNPEHSGGHRALPRLIQRLLGCTEEEAKRLVQGPRSLPSEADSLADFRRILTAAGAEVAKRTTTLKLPSEFKSLLVKSRLAGQFRYYLHDRGITIEQLPWVCEHYDLHYATTGRDRYRIIFPLWDRNYRLQSWTGRTILDDEPKRYRMLSRAESVTVASDNLLGLPYLWKLTNPKILLVCEGPFDAIRLTLYGRYFGVYATCIFGMKMSQAQASLLIDLRERFSDIRVLLDSTVSPHVVEGMAALAGLRVCYLPTAYKDTGDERTMPAQAVVDFCLSLV